MKLVEINLHPTERQLRQFGLIALGALPLAGYLWSAGNLTVAGTCAAVGAALAALGFFAPRTVVPVYVGLTLVAIPIGLVVSELALAVVFFGLLAPLGLLFRLIGRDALQRKFDRQAASYWQPKRQPGETASYLRQW